MLITLLEIVWPRVLLVLTLINGRINAKIAVLSQVLHSCRPMRLITIILAAKNVPSLFSPWKQPSNALVAVLFPFSIISKITNVRNALFNAPLASVGPAVAVVLLHTFYKDHNAY